MYILATNFFSVSEIVLPQLQEVFSTIIFFLITPKSVYAAYIYKYKVRINL